MTATLQGNNRVDLPDEDVEAALTRVVNSEIFSGAPRLKEFLVYVVRTHLEKPGEKIPAKAIAHDIYDRPLDSGSDNENIVRVDAGRLRRRLGEYYAGQGEDDPIHIHIDPGGYSPRFEDRRGQSADRSGAGEVNQSNRQTLKKSLVAAAVVVVAVVAGFSAGLLVGGSGYVQDKETKADSSNLSLGRTAERLALLEKSPTSVQAVNLAEQARNLIFPMFELEQLDLALRMFRQSIRKDEDYYGGYAGAAQSLGAFALFLPDGGKRDELLSEARFMAERAMKLAPTEAWTQSAAAWVAYQDGDDMEAVRLSRQALDLAPIDGNVLDFHAVLLLLIGDHEGSEDASSPDRKRLTAHGRLANRSFHGAALFHLGRYQDAIASLQAATAKGAPVSAPTLAYLAAAHQALGNNRDAERYAQQLVDNWPSFRADVVFGRIYRSRQQSQVVHDLLLDAGWQPQHEDFPVNRNPTEQ